MDETKKKSIEKHQKRAEELKKRGAVKEKGDLTNAEIALRTATIPQQQKLDKANKDIDKARMNLNDAKNAGDQPAIDAAKKALAEAKRDKDIIRGAKHKDANGNDVAKVVGGLADLEEKVSKTSIKRS